jgi:hypothetical protein
MTYDEVIAAFFTPPAAPGAELRPVREASPARRLRDAVEPLAMHSVWSRRTNEALAAEGLDFLAAYVGGRAAALGRPTAGVVVATFAVFEPSLVTGAHLAATAACDRDVLLDVRRQATVDSLREVLGGVATGAIREVVAVLRPALADAPALGRPLFAGLADLAWPDDDVGQLWRCCELLREHRGDGHVGVLVAEGLDGSESNLLTELWLGGEAGAYSGTRGWSADQLDAAAQRLARRGLVDAGRLTDEGRRLRDHIESATDRSQDHVTSALGDRLEAVTAQLADWSDRCVAARAFPPDPFKRAAG